MKGIEQIIKKFEKSFGKIMNHDEVTKLICQFVPEYEWQKTKIHKMIFLLRSKWYIYDIKKQLYLIIKPNTQILENDLVQKYYRQLLKDHCELYCDKNRYISGYKALELRSNNYEIATEIYITNPIKTSFETNMLDYKIWFKKYSNKWYSDLEYFKKLQKFTDKITINGKKFAIASIELAILESLFSPIPATENYIYENIKKALKKYKKTLNFTKISNIIQLWKHHTSLNRLYNLAKVVDQEMSQNIYNIIKKYSYVL